MNLPFTQDQFLEVFMNYNLAMWPGQIIAYILGSLAVVLAVQKSKHSGRIISTVLGLMWFVNGFVYHITFFSGINKAALVFGSLFVIQSILFFIFGVFKNELKFEYDKSAFSYTGLAFIVYAMILYPIIGYVLGHGYPNSPSFGIAPCPTTIFTFGLMLMLKPKIKPYIFIIPAIWSLIGFFAALKLGIIEDVGLLIAGAAGTIMLIRKNKTMPE